MTRTTSLYKNNQLSLYFDSQEDWRAPSREEWLTGDHLGMRQLQRCLADRLNLNADYLREHFIPTRSCTDALRVALEVSGLAHQTCVHLSPIRFPIADRLLQNTYVTWKKIDPKKPWACPGGAEEVDIVTELYGMPAHLCGMKPGKPVIVDAAHSLPSVRHAAWGYVHTWVAFSFGPLKLPNMPLGGGLLCPSKYEHEQAWRLLDFGRNSGYKICMAAATKGLLEKPFYGPLAKRLDTAYARQRQYRETIAKIYEVVDPKYRLHSDFVEHASGHLAVIHCGERLEEAKRVFAKYNVDTSIHYPGTPAVEHGLLSIPCCHGLYPGDPLYAAIKELP